MPECSDEMKAVRPWDGCGLVAKPSAAVRDGISSSSAEGCGISGYGGGGTLLRFWVCGFRGGMELPWFVCHMRHAR